MSHISFANLCSFIFSVFLELGCGTETILLVVDVKVEIIDQTVEP